jgi:hypothetical protein
MTTTFFNTTAGGARKLAGWLLARVMIVVRLVAATLGESECRWFSAAAPVFTLPAPISGVGFMVTPLVVAWLRWERSVQITTHKPVVVGFRYLNWTWRTQRATNVFSVRIWFRQWDSKTGHWYTVSGRLAMGKRVAA